MPFNLLGSLTVEDKSNGELVMIEHGLRDVISVTQLVDESVSLSIEQKSSYSSQRLSREEFDLGVRLVRVNETC